MPARGNGDDERVCSGSHLLDETSDGGDGDTPREGIGVVEPLAPSLPVLTSEGEISPPAPSSDCNADWVNSFGASEILKEPNCRKLALIAPSTPLPLTGHLQSSTCLRVLCTLESRQVAFQTLW